MAGASARRACQQLLPDSLPTRLHLHLGPLSCFSTPVNPDIPPPQHQLPTLERKRSWVGGEVRRAAHEEHLRAWLKLTQQTQTGPPS